MNESCARENFYDITIIGGGPAGMFAAYYAGLRNAKVQLIESLSELGGQVKSLYPEKTILDVAGFTGLSGNQLIDRLKEQIDSVDAEVKLNESVTGVKPISCGYQIDTNQSKTQSKAIIVATGNGAFHPRRLMAKNTDQFEGSQLHYSVNDLNQFKDKDVLVAGGGDAAIDDALMLEGVAKQVYLLHRRSEFRGLETNVDKLHQSSIKLVTPYLIRELQSTTDGKIDVIAKKMRTKDEMEHTLVDELVVNYGAIADHKAMKNWQIDLEGERRQIKVTENMATTAPHVYAIGDNAMYESKRPLIATAFGEAPLAVNEIMSNLYPTRREPLHSTSMHTS